MKKFVTIPFSSLNKIFIGISARDTCVPSKKNNFWVDIIHKKKYNVNIVKLPSW